MLMYAQNELADGASCRYARGRNGHKRFVATGAKNRLVSDSTCIILARSMNSHRSTSFARLRFAGALIALLGFLSQYPIPALHRCPVMNPAAYADEHGDHGDGHHAHVQRASVVPPCHRRLAATAETSGHEQHAETESNRDGHHQHSSCPVCQGYLQLLTLAQAAPAPLLVVALQPILTPTVLEGVRVRVADLRLPGSRGPPAFS